MYVHTLGICYLVIKGIIMSLYKRTTYRMCFMSCDRKYMFAGLFKSTDTQDDNNMYVLSYSTKSCAMHRLMSAFPGVYKQEQSTNKI